MENLPLIQVCSYCNQEQATDYKFCADCGRRNVDDLKIERQKSTGVNRNIRSLAIYALLSIILLLIGAFTDETIEDLIIWSVVFAIVDITFAFYQPSVWALLKPNLIKLLPLITITTICIASGFIVSYSMGKMNFFLFEEDYTTMHLFYHLKYPLLYAIILIAVFPALFEELAFRGFVYNNLKVIGGEKSAIWGSTFLFALVHFSLLSLIWLIPFALMLSHYRKKYSTLLYGMVGHFTHNATTILIEYYELF